MASVKTNEALPVGKEEQQQRGDAKKNKSRCIINIHDECGHEANDDVLGTLIKQRENRIKQSEDLFVVRKAWGMFWS